MKRIALVLFAAISLLSCNNRAKEQQASGDKDLRIVSLAPSITMELLDLELKDKIVGVTSYCELSAENEDLVIGTASDVNIEKIILLKPDLVFATGLTKESTIQTLKRNGIVVHHVPRLYSFDDICRQFIILGQLVGKESLAQSIVEKSVRKIDSMKQQIPLNHEKQKVFFQIGAKPLFTVIPNTFMNDFITFSGNENLAYDLERGTMTRESVLIRNPDIIFIVTMGIVGDEEKAMWESYRDISAIKNEKIFVLDSNLACTPTVLAFTETLENIIADLY